MSAKTKGVWSRDRSGGKARAEARAVASVVGREALRECVCQREKRQGCCALVKKECVVRGTEGEERAAARAMSSAVGRKALWA